MNGEEGNVDVADLVGIHRCRDGRFQLARRQHQGLEQFAEG